MRRLLDFKLLITGLILGHFTLGTVSCDKDNDDPDPKDNTEQEKGGEDPASKKDSVDNGGTTKDDALKYTEAQLKAANTAENVSYLSKEEKLVVYYMNLARMDGKMFIETYLKDLKSSNKIDEKSLIEELSIIKGLPMLYPNQKLCEAASFHAKDIGDAGLVQHESSDGTSPGERIKRYYNGGAMAENVSCAFEDGMNIVMQMLVDEGIENHVHRANILNPKFNRIGVSIHSHSKYNYCCVQDFSDEAGE